MREVELWLMTFVARAGRSDCRPTAPPVMSDARRSEGWKKFRGGYCACSRGTVSTMRGFLLLLVLVVAGCIQRVVPLHSHRMGVSTPPRVTSSTFSEQRIHFIQEKEYENEVHSTSALSVALIEVSFDQPMYMNGNKSMGLSTATDFPGGLKNTCTLSCMNGTKLFNSMELNPLELAPIPHSRDTASPLLPFTHLIESKLREGNALFPESNIFRATLVLAVENYHGSQLRGNEKWEPGIGVDLLNFPADQLSTCTIIMEGVPDNRTAARAENRTVVRTNRLTNYDGVGAMPGENRGRLVRSQTKETIVHDVFFSNKGHSGTAHPVPTAVIEEVMQDKTASSALGALGSPMAPKTFIWPVADQAFRDMVPRLINMLQNFLRAAISAAMGFFFTGFDSDNKAPPVPTFVAERGAAEAAAVAELVMSMADEKAEKAAYAAEIAAGVGAEAAAYAAAVAKAVGFKGQVSSKIEDYRKKVMNDLKFIEMPSSNSTASPIVAMAADDHKSIATKARCLTNPHGDGCEQVGLEEIGKKFRDNLDTSLLNAQKASHESRTCKIVAAQVASMAKHHRELAKKTEKHIQETYEYRLLTMARHVVKLATNASEAARRCVLAQKILARTEANTAQIFLNASKMVTGHLKQANVPHESFSRHFPPHTVHEMLNSTIALIETNDMGESVMVDGAESRMVMDAFVEESFKAHQSGMAAVRIEADQWNELRTGDPAKPKQPLGYTQKTIVHKLAHSLTTELSDQLTRSLTTHLVRNMQEILTDVLSGVVPGKVAKGITHAIAPGVSQAVSYTATVIILRLLPLVLTASLEHTLTNTLTKALTHSLSSTLTHTLRYNPKQEAMCYYCMKDGVGCEHCHLTPQATRTNEYYLNHDAAYFGDYYALYYTGVGNPRPS
jgi:hypothetical protein